MIKKGAPINIDKNKEKTSKEAKSKWNKVSYTSMKILDNKNAIVTGEFESIFFDTLEEEYLQEYLNQKKLNDFPISELA